MYQVPKGTSDILPDQQFLWNFIKDTAKNSSTTFGFEEIETPTFEETELFERGVGSDSDIVQKEMYSFTDSSEKSFTLKPEGTAAVCRAFIQNGMNNLPKPIRLFYISSMFRHERPQSGRLRQHHQFGAEIFGDESPEIDTELIELGLHYLNSLGLKKLKIKINSIGDKNTRIKLSEDLKKFFEPYKSKMNNIDKKRLETNPIRLLDSKDANLISITKNCPRSIDYLDKESQSHWESVLENIQNLTKIYNKFEIEIDHKLVRGLDYYNRTVFEIHPNEERSQSSILSGGRYDGLINLLGGPDVPGVGFGSGIERIIININ
ncbi:MAG TPA: histidine--tRNA ligase, partial [Dehalococcoidia bacterium]|nr:histidine--tRNA ligase [Dehalococcoidia bacterium]